MEDRITLRQLFEGVGYLLVFAFIFILVILGYTL